MKEFPTELTKPKKSPETTDGSTISRFDKLSKSTVGKTLRAGIAAGSIASAQPALAETPQQEPVESEETTLIIDDQEIMEASTDTLERARIRYTEKKLAEVITSLEKQFEETNIKHYSHKAEKLKKQQASPEFREGLLYLAEIDADITMCITITEPDRLRDIAWLKQRVADIPSDVRDKIRISFSEFETRESYYDPGLYTDPDFKETLDSFAQQNAKPSTFLVDTIRKHEDYDQKQQLTDASSYLLTKKMSSEDIIFLFLDNVEDFSLLKNDQFLDAIITLHDLGIETSTISAAIKSQDAYKITSEDYVTSIKKLQEAGLEISRETMSGLPAKDLPPQAIDNIKAIISQYANLERDVYKIPIEALSQEDLVTLIDSLYKNKEITEKRDGTEIINTLKLTITTDENSEPAVFQRVKKIAEQTSTGFNPFDGISLIDDVKIADPVYRELLLSYLEEGRTRKTIDRKAVDSIYLKKVIGKNIDAIQDDIQTFSRISQQPDNSVVTKKILEAQEYFIYMDFVRDMSREDSQTNRLQDLKGLNARTKFDILATAGEHGWTSTRNLIYDGYHIAEDAPERSFTLYNSIIDEYGDAYAFLTEVNPSSTDLSSFLEILAQIGKVESFFELIGSDEQKSEVVQKFLLGLEQTSDTHSKVAGLVEALRTLKWNGAEEIILMGIENEVERLTALIETKTLAGSKLEKTQDAILWHELITASYYKKHSQSNPSKWGQTALEKYGDKLPLFETIPEATLFPNDTHIRYHTFFNNWDSQNGIKDKDGHRSFETTLKRFGGSVKFDKDGKLTDARGGRGGWQIKMQSNGDGNYVVMTKTDKESGRKMINIMNSPKMTNEQVVDFYNNMSDNFSDEDTGAHGVQGFVMRGHNVSSISDTAVTTFNNLVDSGKSDIPYVNFGSCGGYKYGQKILGKSSSSFFFGTQGTGMADVNVNVQMRDMEYSLATGEYNSIDLQRMSNKKFEGYSTRMQDGYKSYRWPHDNDVVQVFAAFNNVKNNKK